MAVAAVVEEAVVEAEWVGANKCIGKDKKVYSFFSVMNLNLKDFIYYFGQLFLLLLLFRKDVNDGGKELFKEQKWKGIDVTIVVISYISLELIMKMLFSITSFKSIYEEILQLVLPKNQLILYTILYKSILLIILIALFRLRFKQGISGFIS